MNKTFRISFEVVIDEQHESQLLKNPQAYTNAIFPVFARRIKDECFAVTEPTIEAVPNVGD